MSNHIISEEQLDNVVRKILVEINLNDYSEEDFIEIFYDRFRPWVKKNHGDEIGMYPLSFLIKTYLNDFCKEYDIDVYTYGTTVKKMADAGKQFVRKKLSNLPSLRKQEKFTEKFKKGIELIVKNLDLPDYVTFKFTEDHLYDVHSYIAVDFPRFIKSNLNSDGLRDIMRAQDKLRSNFEHFLGATYGNPAYGQLKLMSSSSPDMIGEDEWIKNVLNKQIKKEIKKLPGASFIHSIKYERERFNVHLKLTFKSNSRWTTHNEITQSVKNYLEENGYNTLVIGVRS